jgi:hypothetical protein
MSNAQQSSGHGGNVLIPLELTASGNRIATLGEVPAGMLNIDVRLDEPTLTLSIYFPGVPLQFGE